MFLKGAFNYSVCRKHQTLVPIICASFAASKSMADQQVCNGNELRLGDVEDSNIL